MASVLIADDEANIRVLVRTLLETEGHVVFEAADGAEALAQVGANAPDCLILDVKMPKMDGHAVLRKLQAEGESHRVIMLTGATSEEDYLRAWGGGADGYVAKPFEPEDLVGAVERVLNMSVRELEEHRQHEIERARLLRQLDRFLE